MRLVNIIRGGGKVLVTGQVQLFSVNGRQATPWFSSPRPDLILWVTVTVCYHHDRHTVRMRKTFWKAFFLVVVLTYYWLNCRICRCRFVTLSKRPVQCLGQNGRHVTSRHGVGLDTQNVNKMAWKRSSWMSWIWLHSRLSRLDFFRVDAPVVVLVQKGPNSNPDLLGPEMQKKGMPQFEFQTKTLETIKQVKHFKLQLRMSNYLKLQEINFNSFQQISKGQDLRLAPETRCTGTPDSGFGFKSGFSFQYSAILGMSWIPNLLPQSGTKGIKLAALRSSRTWCSFASYLGSQPSLALTYLQHWH